MAGGQGNDELVNYHEVGPAVGPAEEEFDEEHPPLLPPSLRREDEISRPPIRTQMYYDFPTIEESSGLFVFKFGRYKNIGVITGNVATFHCRETYTQAIGEHVWVHQVDEDFMRLICARLPGLMPAPLHDQMQEPMVG